ncbi:DUF294 nucleotidyltransferase-like domain-containing protein [Alicyclobacillus ferrooxydans]|uniref:Uncharacterized protein n=1 Tax=Alicyclobacillus ferrooxydans TaxID=471514 RepID=A0A0N8PPG3_9BACL|nr:DUF294 nucleotidyltransferase-like domain-containing protein [Alicyclobacillus ferrooxydans]KPV44245.1 hypothetical protein AN477_08065 [Alicyclobacillus ferrooxydans]
MTSIVFPDLSWDWAAGQPPLSTVLKWQEDLRQITRHWFRAGASTTEWLTAYHQLRMSLLADVWTHTIPRDHLGQLEYIVLGSSARGEDVFDSDLDHALLFHGAVAMEEIRPYLYEFIQTMALLGFPPCQGFVMGTNERWAGELPTWQDRIDSYFQFPDWENVRYLFMLLDSKPLFALSPSPTPQFESTAVQRWETLRRSVLQRIQSSPYLCWEMAHLGIHNTVSQPKRTNSLFKPKTGAVQTNRVNVKSGLLSPVIHSIRLLSVAHGVAEIATERRLAALTEQQALDRDMTKKLEACISFCWRIRIREHVVHPYKDSLPNEVSQIRITEQELAELMEHAETAKKLERMVERRFRKLR